MKSEAPKTLLISAFCAAQFLLLTAPARAVERQVLHGHIPAAAGRLQSMDRLASSKHLDLAIALPLRNRTALTGLLEQLYDPASPGYHQYLTPEQFAERFGPTDTDYQAVIAFAKANGLAVTGTHPNRTLLDVNGSVAAIEKTFRVNLRVYQHPKEARLFYAPDAEPSLDLAVPVLTITGLDDFSLPRPMGLNQSALDKSPRATPYATGSGPRGGFFGRDFRTAYAPSVVLDGAGQSVGLIEFDGYYPSDIATYENLTGLPNVPLTNVLVGTFRGSAGANNVEVALDIEMVISMAPGLAKVIVYEGRLPNDILNRMATDNLARQLSSSWAFGQAVDSTREQIFLQFAAQGQSMFQASGDLGAWVGQIAPPSDDPFITVVGGTMLTTSGRGGPWLSETVWPGSGGGISTSNAIPSWQRGVSMSANHGSASLRNIPDVACHGDENIWIIANNGEQGTTGGTSASSPLWAAFTALANQQAAASGQPSVGFINPAIYTIGKGVSYGFNFHDTTIGNNTNGSSGSNFLAVLGYDLCTGWGTPNGSNLISALLAPPDLLRITPAKGLTANGPAGGPFTPTTQGYSLTNFGTGPLNWTLLNTSLWFIASPGSGVLTPGGPATIVTLGLDASAGNLAAGSYAATLWFTNHNEGSAQGRQFTLAIVTTPVITGQPANQQVFEGMTATFTVETATNALLFYQWQQDNGSYLTNLADGGNLSGATTSTLTVSNVSPANVGAYSVIVSNAAGVVPSSNAFLTLVPWRPVITAHPTNRIALPGEKVTVSVAAVGSQPLFYTWLESETNVMDGGNVSGSGTSSLTFNNVSAGNAGTYSVIVSNELGWAISTGALLSVVSVTAPGIAMATLYSFADGNHGVNPNGLAQGADGNFYGTTQHGGPNSSGTVFQLSADETLGDLHSFTGGNDGANPFAALAQGRDGSFYGTTFQGGDYDIGAVFRITTSGTFTNLISLNITNGDLPYAGLALGVDENFYGTSYQGGAYGHGTVFRITTNGTLTTLWSFTGGADGAFPYAGVLQAADGMVYGTTYKGGTYGDGTAFRTTTNGTLTTLASLNFTNGAFPYGGLAQGSDGNFYGATSSGGSYGSGTIFRMTPKGLLTNLYSFTGGSDGRGPAAALLQGSDGNFYGTTAYGGAYDDGTIFRVAPNGTVATLAGFDGFNGANPRATLVQDMDGNFYGTTQNGGAAGHGTIFRLSITNVPPQITTQPASQSVFAGANVLFNVAVFGSQPLFYQWRENTTNLADGGNLLGAATRTLAITNVSVANSGTYSVLVSNAFRPALSADAVLQVTSSPPVIVMQPTNQTMAPGATARFTVTALGNLPLSYHWQKNTTSLTDGGNLSGSATSALTLSGVTEANNGTYAVIVSNALDSVPSTGAVLTVIPVSVAGTRMTTLHWFSGGIDGRIPNGLARGTNGALYGTTQFGGAHLSGTVFSITTNGTFTTLAAFNESIGSEPLAPPIQGADGKFYGTTEFGGDFGAGGVFTMTPDGTLSNLYSFTGDSDGGLPSVALVQGSDGNFYGANNFGRLFRITPEGALTNLYSFTGGTDGDSAAGALVQGTDGNFYGVTKHNVIQGYQFYGTIFRITTSGLLSTLYPLNYTDGSYPYAGLIQGSDGNFYGTTHDGGASGNGTLFRISPDGTLATLVSFDGFDDGGHPKDTVVEGADGNLYGTTTSGGPGGQGTIFRLSFTSSPQITSQPANQTALLGANVLFSVAAFGRAPLHYQWLKNGTNLIDGGPVFGSDTRTLVLTNVTGTDSGTYSVTVSNALDSVTSAGALLTVVSPPVFQTVAKSNNTVRLTWSAATGQRYQLQYKPNLSALNWTNLNNAVTATNGAVAVSDVIGSNSQRFYRVVLLP